MDNEDYVRHYSIIKSIIDSMPDKNYKRIYSAVEFYRKENNFDQAFFNIVMAMARIDFLNGVFEVGELESV